MAGQQPGITLPAHSLRKNPLLLPQISAAEAVNHFVALSRLDNFSVRQEFAAALPPHFLPLPIVRRTGDEYRLLSEKDLPLSIGRLGVHPGPVEALMRGLCICTPHCAM